jgi:hypothetical protein
MYRSSVFMKKTITSAGKEITVSYVNKTDAWERTMIAQKLKDEFTAIAEKYKDTLKPSTVEVAVKYGPG